jgi:hypothetical protein
VCLILFFNPLLIKKVKAELNDPIQNSFFNTKQLSSSRDGPSDISGSSTVGHVARMRFLLTPTAATDHLASADHCYYHPH